MRTTKITVRINPRTNSNPNNGPVGPAGFYAEPDRDGPDGFSDPWVGSPLGRGETPGLAVLDLLRRANRESGTAIGLSDLITVGE